MDTVERVKMLLKIEGMSRAGLAEKSGIDKNRWDTVLKRRGRLSDVELQALEAIWPAYGYWIAYGKELLDVGQVSPARKWLK